MISIMFHNNVVIYKTVAYRQKALAFCNRKVFILHSLSTQNKRTPDDPPEVCYTPDCIFE